MPGASPVVVVACASVLPYRAASCTPGCARSAVSSAVVTVLRENKVPEAVDSNARWETGILRRAEMPSSVSPTVRPLSTTPSSASSATTRPISAKRPRANRRSRTARNTGFPSGQSSEGYRH